ncbi:MAG TPA: FG-GAP-like repeat-containing protein, partial [Myxococcaceae bacterium]|nr:FG-GAP-like repeat-containing protein [Myxococcaceae bacterium]
GRSPYTWAVTTASLPAGLSLNAGTGAVSGTPTVANASNSFGVTVTDANGVTVSRGFTLGVYTLPSITTSSLAEGYGGDPYSATLQATGGKGPTLSFSITAGALPPGLTLSSNGTLGTALGAVANGQTYNFTVTVADANGRLGSRALSITTWLVPSVTNTGLTTATEGITYRRAPGTPEGITAQNGKPPLTYAAAGLPAGLSLSASTGVISGIPAQGAAGDYNVTLRVTDASSQQGSRVLPLRVNAAQPIAYGGTGGLEPAGSPITDVLTVFVIDSAGRPVQNLGVRVRKNGAEYSPVKQALTNAAGRVFFTGMGCNGTTDTVDVTVNGPGFANFTLAKVNAALVTLTPAEYPLPMPRYAAAASFDGSVGRVVLTGGYTDPNGYASNRSACVDDVVRYAVSTNTWTEEVTPGLTTSPSPRGHAAMAYGGGLNVLFGGEDCHDGFYLGDTWEWNATTRAWLPGGGATRPSARTGAMMTINAAGNGVLLFGGYTGAVHTEELWNYDVGTHSWNMVFPLTNSPAGRYHGGAAYHGANAEMWICGGLGASGELADCAGYHSSSRSWNVRPSLPQARSSFAMAYGGWMFIFGGQSGGVDRNDLLFFDGATWQTVAVPPGAARPQARTQASLVYDQSSGKLVLVGGYSRIHGVLNDWWTYDTVNGWVQRNTPPAAFGTTVVGTITGGKNTAGSFAQVTLTGASGYSSQQTVQLTGGSGSYTFSGVPVGDTVQVVAVNEDRTLAYPGNPSRFWSYASSGTLTAAAAGLTHNVVFPAGPLALLSATGTYSLPNEWPSALVTGFPRQQRPGFPAATNGGFAVTAPGTFRFDYFTPAAPAVQTAYLGARNDDPTGCELSYFHWNPLSPGAQGNVGLVAGPRSITPGQSVCRPAGNGFRYRATVEPGLDPVAVALGDVDGDGLQDMAVANSSGNSVTVAFGQGAGYFGEPGDADYVTLTTSVNNPTGVVIADVDGDNRGEVLVTNSFSATPGTLAVFKWQTSGSFATPLTFNVGSRPAGLAVAEINNDNRPDVVVVNYGSGTLTPLTGNGSGAFTAQNTIALPAGAAGPAAVAIADVTGDGRVDAVVAAYDTNNVVVFNGNGNVSGTLFGYNRTIVAGIGPRALALGDVNNDGRRDLVVANEFDSSLFIYPGTGTTSAFGTSSGIALDGAPTAVAVAELTGDSFRDVAVTVAITNELRVYRGSSTGVVSTAYDIRGTNESPVALAVADLVLDGKADIAVACYSGLVPYYVQLTPLPTATEGTYSFAALAGTRMYWASRGPSRLVMDWQYVSRGAPGTNSFSFPSPSSLASSRPAPSGQTVAWDVSQYSYPASSAFSYDNFRWRELRQDATNFVASQGHAFIRQ